MARPRKYTNEQMIGALKKCKGMVYLAARSIGCDPETIYTRAKDEPSVAAALKTERGKVIDVAELKLYEAILAGEAWAIALALRTLGKERGYAEKVELEVAGKVRKEIVEEIVDASETPNPSDDQAAPGPG